MYRSLTTYDLRKLTGKDREKGLIKSYNEYQPGVCYALFIFNQENKDLSSFLDLFLKVNKHKDFVVILFTAESKNEITDLEYDVFTELVKKIKHYFVDNFFARAFRYFFTKKIKDQGGYFYFHNIEKALLHRVRGNLPDSEKRELMLGNVYLEYLTKAINVINKKSKLEGVFIYTGYVLEHDVPVLRDQNLEIHLRTIKQDYKNKGIGIGLFKKYLKDLGDFIYKKIDIVVKYLEEKFPDSTFLLSDDGFYYTELKNIGWNNHQVSLKKEMQGFALDGADTILLLGVPELFKNNSSLKRLQNQLGFNVLFLPFCACCLKSEILKYDSLTLGDYQKIWQEYVEYLVRFRIGC